MARLGKKIDWSANVDVSDWELGDEVFEKVSEASGLLQDAFALAVKAIIGIALEEGACISIDDGSQAPTAMKVGFPFGYYECESVYFKVDLREIVDEFISNYTGGGEFNDDETMTRAAGLRDALREMADKLDRCIPKGKT